MAIYQDSPLPAQMENTNGHRLKSKTNKVIVWNKEIQQPVSVRYAWGDNPDDANLYNAAGLPASPFEGTSANKRPTKTEKEYRQ